MLELIARRLLGLPVLFFLVSLGVFSLVALVPGDPAVTLAGGENATEERIEEVREELGFNEPFLVRYGQWVGDAITGDFGDSLITGESVTAGIRTRYPITFSIVLLAVLFGLVIGVPAGIIAGMRPGTTSDRLGMLASSAGLAIPNFWLAMILISLFSVRLGWVPALGFTRFSESPIEWFKSAVLPAISLGIFVAASVSRQLRAGLISVMGSNYVRTAWAKGGGPARVVGKHSMKNASMATVTVLGLQFTALLGGSVIIEQIFSIPGLGTYLLNAVTAGDLPVIQGVVMFFVILNVGLTLVLDIVYGILNPKVRVS